MTLSPKEGLPIVLLLAVLACLTFLGGFYYGRITAPEQGPIRLVLPVERRPLKQIAVPTEPCKPRYECLKVGAVEQ